MRIFVRGAPGIGLNNDNEGMSPTRPFARCIADREVGLAPSAGRPGSRAALPLAPLRGKGIVGHSLWNHAAARGALGTDLTPGGGPVGRIFRTTRDSRWPLSLKSTMHRAFCRPSVASMPPVRSGSHRTKRIVPVGSVSHGGRASRIGPLTR